MTEKTNERATIREVHDLIQELRKENKEDMNHIIIKVDRIEGKVDRIVGWAAGAGAVAGVAITFIKDFFLKK